MRLSGKLFLPCVTVSNSLQSLCHCCISAHGSRNKLSTHEHVHSSGAVVDRCFSCVHAAMVSMEHGEHRWRSCRSRTPRVGRYTWRCYRFVDGNRFVAIRVLIKMYERKTLGTNTASSVEGSHQQPGSQYIIRRALKKKHSCTPKS